LISTTPHSSFEKDNNSFNSFLEILTHTFYTLGAAKRSVVNTHTHTDTHHITEGEREIRRQILRGVLKEGTTRTHTNTKEEGGKKDVQQQYANESVFSARGAARNFFATKERRRRGSDHGIPEYEYE
jgi:hypothetical protein|tara:strand:+ start:2179 stop:2559 length:381 start_codon:yes stop_codon:yes gene_type:complete